MQITKYLHSCLLIEEQNKTILIDPGVFTYNEHALDINKLTKLDYIAITHEHADHFHLPFIKDLVQKFPDVKIVSTPSVVELLKKVGQRPISLGLKNIKATSESDEVVKIEISPHERLWDVEAPENVTISIFDKLTHVGDSICFIKSCGILALPITAPWGSTTDAVNKALEIRPKIIIPIHDWMWKDEVRIGMYQRLKDFFATKEIDFKTPETGEIVEI